MSTEPIESIASRPPAAPAAAACATCGSPLAGDQRYCLQCGERAVALSVAVPGDPPSFGASAEGARATVPGASTSGSSPPGPLPPPTSPPGATPPLAPGAGQLDSPGNALTVIAGVGVLLLAMGIGVLIGRAGGKPSAGAATPQVISVSSAPSSATTAAEPEPFTGDWPVGSSGYTVRLQALPVASTQASAVQAAKSAAEAKGAKAVGALKSDEFPSLAAGSYIVYSGKYTKKSQASKALGSLKKKFPEAKVLQVGSGAVGGGKGVGAGTSGGKSGVGSSSSNPAPPSVVENLKSKSGKSYEEQSKNLPNVVSTG